MGVQFQVFTVPAAGGEDAEAALNGFLRGRKILRVDRVYSEGSPGAWLFCVEFLGDATDKATGVAGKRTDYKEVLSPDVFEVFSKLRVLRKAVAEEEGVPVYSVFTNEQLAELAGGGIGDVGAMGRIDGIGRRRIEKYGERFLECLRAAGSGGGSR